jgi:hypothetical protein
MSLDPRESAKMDQALAAVTEIFPPLWHGLYVRLIRQGFNETQALELVKAYIAASCRPS